MSKLVLAFFCVVLLQIASALDCYKCTGPSCETETKTWEKKSCGASGANPSASHQWACLKQSYKDKATQKKVVERKCFLAELRDGKPTYNCPVNIGDQVECPLCQTDLCNSAHTVTFSFVGLCGVIMAVLAPKLL